MLGQGSSTSGWLHQALFTGFSHIQQDSSTMCNRGAMTFASANIASAVNVRQKVGYSHCSALPLVFLTQSDPGSMQEMRFTEAQTDAFLSGNYTYHRFRILVCEYFFLITGGRFLHR